MISRCFIDLFLYNPKEFTASIYIELTIKTFLDIQKDTSITEKTLVEWFVNIKDLTFKYFLLMNSERWKSIILKHSISKHIDCKLSLDFLTFLINNLKNYSSYQYDLEDDKLNHRCEKVYEYFHMYYKYSIHFKQHLDVIVFQNIIDFLDKCQKNKKIGLAPYLKACIYLFLHKRNILLNPEHNIKEYFNEAFFSLIDAIKKDYFKAYHELGVYYLKGFNKKEHGLELIARASDMEYKKSSLYLATIYDSQIKTNLTDTEVVKAYYFDSIDGFECLSVLKLRELFENEPQRFDIYLSIAEKKNETILLNLGKMYYYGIFVEGDVEKARDYWFQIIDINLESRSLLQETFRNYQREYIDKLYHTEDKRDLYYKLGLTCKYGIISKKDMEHAKMFWLLGKDLGCPKCTILFDSNLAYD